MHKVLKLGILKAINTLLPSLRLILKNIARIKFDDLPKTTKYQLALLTAELIKKFRIEKADFSYYDFFELWQKNGFHITPNHFYQPIPDTTKIPKRIFSEKSEMVGINLNETVQVNLLQKVFVKYRNEYNKITNKPDSNSHIYSFNNLAFDGVDGLVYYCMIRSLNPKTIIEIGSGWSTKIAAQAVLLNKNTQLICVEPYPQSILKKGFPGLNKVIPKDVQKIPIEFFSQLGGNDILFIDSTHTVKAGGDVSYLFLEVLPRLKKDVVVHIHDIFFPFNYPEEWVIKEKRFWAEQYILQSFLAFNSSFQILYSNSYMGYKFPKQIRKTFPKSPFFSGGSIWIKKVK